MIQIYWGSKELGQIYKLIMVELKVMVCSGNIFRFSHN